MTWQDMIRIKSYQQRNPPQVAIVRAIAETLGIKIKSPDELQGPMTAEQALLLLRSTGGRVPDWAL